jgi:hypothetical protein
VIYFSGRLTVPDDLLQQNGHDIPFVNNVTYLGVTSEKMTTWKHHAERILAKALHTQVRACSLLRSGRLSSNIKTALYKALMIYASPTWEYAVDAHLLKLQNLQNRTLRAIGNFERCTPVR